MPKKKRKGNGKPRQQTFVSRSKQSTDALARQILSSTSQWKRSVHY